MKIPKIRREWGGEICTIKEDWFNDPYTHLYLYKKPLSENKEGHWRDPT